MTRFPFVLAYGQPPVARDAVFDHLKTGDLWNENAQYIDDWYAIEKIDDQTIIIGEPKSSEKVCFYWRLHVQTSWGDSGFCAW